MDENLITLIRESDEEPLLIPVNINKNLKELRFELEQKISFEKTSHFYFKNRLILIEDEVKIKVGKILVDDTLTVRNKKSLKSNFRL
jgi:hypothetical protein